MEIQGEFGVRGKDEVKKEGNKKKKMPGF